MSYVLDEVVSGVGFESFYEAPFQWPLVYTRRGSMSRRERFTSVGGIGQFQQKTPGTAPAEADVSQQFQKTFVHNPFALQLPFEREFVDDEEWGTVEELGREIGLSAAQTMEVAGAALFNDAFAGATYTAEDALSICSSAHLNVDGGNSQDNSGTSAISMAAIKATRTAMRKFTNYRGEKISVNPDMLIVPVAIEEDSWEIVRSTNRPDGANLVANMYNGMFRLIVWPFLTDDESWFMVDSRLMARHLLWFQRVPLEFHGDGSLFNGTRRIGGYYRESHGCRDWRWIYGHTV
jgi:phage major head subunit gpT-like protein